MTPRLKCTSIHSKFDWYVTDAFEHNLHWILCYYTPAKQVRNSGVMFDDTFSFNKYISSTHCSIYFVLRKIGHKEVSYLLMNHA